MDKTTAYRKILKEYISYKASLKLSNWQDAIVHPIMDTERDEFLLIWTGWTDQKHNHSLMFHLQIIDSKIWIHENRTDTDLVEVLKEKGVAASDIIVGFVPLYLQENIEVAA